VAQCVMRRGEGLYFRNHEAGFLCELFCHPMQTSPCAPPPACPCTRTQVGYGAKEQWGDKWTEQFGAGKGTKHGEVWSMGAGGER
jgi:hypothetical protein